MQEASFIDDEYDNREPGGNDHHWRGFFGGGGNMSLRMGKCLEIGPVRSGRGLGCWRYREEETRNVVMTLEREMV